MDLSQLTVTQRRIVELLMDGEAHKLPEMMKCLDDELSEKSNLHVHLALVRPKLQKGGIDILVRKGLYRMVRLYKPNSAE